MIIQPVTLFLLMAAAFLAGGFFVGWRMISAHRTEKSLTSGDRHD